MNTAQAIDLADAFFIPEFLFADGEEAINSERQKTEEAISTLVEAYFTQENPGFDFETVMILADRNRELCDALSASRLRSNSQNIKRALSFEDTVKSIAALQRRNEKQIMKILAADKTALTQAYLSGKPKGTVIGIDIETTGINPDRDYIINVGYEKFALKPDSQPTDPHSYFCGLPDIYEERGVPLADIHHIQWDTLAGKKPFREDKDLQKELLKVLESAPYMAHNAAFEDSWFLLNLDGYAEGRKAGRIIPIDTREICRKLDPEFPSLPRESKPASLESWARRRHTLGANEQEVHQGLEDVDLMLKTVSQQFIERDMY